MYGAGVFHTSNNATASTQNSSKVASLGTRNFYAGSTMPQVLDQLPDDLDKKYIDVIATRLPFSSQ